MEDRDGRKRSFFDEIFGAGPFEDLEELFERLERSMGMSPESFETRPFVYGFSITFRKPDGERGESPPPLPEFREFGTLPALNPAEEEGFYPEMRRPLIDVLETEGKVHIIAEIPGVEKENIQLNATDLILELETVNGNPKYSERVELPVKVDPQSAKATYKNGVLEVIFKRLGSDSRTSINID